MNDDYLMIIFGWICIIFLNLPYVWLYLSTTKLFCKHENLEFVRNISGDEINFVSLSHVYRSWWRCKNCGVLIPKEELVL